MYELANIDIDSKAQGLRQLNLTKIYSTRRKNWGSSAVIQTRESSEDE